MLTLHMPRLNTTSVRIHYLRIRSTYVRASASSEIGGGAESPELGQWKMSSRHTRPSSGIARLKTPNSTIQKLQRPQTSLGLRRRAEPEPLLGFDVRDYFRRHGSTAGLTVGVNGSPSRDTTLQSYVQACRVDALLQELDHGKDTQGECVSSTHARILHAQRSQRAPLCWDRLVQDTKPPKVG